MKYRKIKSSWIGCKYEQFRYWLISISIGLSNLIFFLPVIWGYRTWGNGDLYLLWAKACERNRLAINNYSYYRDAYKDVNSLKQAEYILKRLANSEEVHWHSQYTGKEGWGMSWTYNHPLAPKRQPEWDMVEHIKHSRLRRKQDIDYLGRLIYKYGEGWSH